VTVLLPPLQVKDPLPVDHFATLWKGHWPQLSYLDLSPFLRPILPWEDDWESTGAGRTTCFFPRPSRCMCRESSGCPQSGRAHSGTFLKLQVSRTVQMGRTLPQAGGTWVTLHTGVSPTLFSSLAHRKGVLSNSRAQGRRCCIL